MYFLSVTLGGHAFFMIRYLLDCYTTGIASELETKLPCMPFQCPPWSNETPQPSIWSQKQDPWKRQVGFQQALGEVCLALNTQIYACIDKMIKEDRAIKDKDIDPFTEDIDPKAICHTNSHETGSYYTNRALFLSMKNNNHHNYHQLWWLFFIEWNSVILMIINDYFSLREIMPNWCNTIQSRGMTNTQSRSSLKAICLLTQPLLARAVRTECSNIRC